MKRRWLLLGALSPLLGISTADAGTYIRNAALLVTASAEDSRYLERRVSDKELAKTVQAVAAARIDAAGRMLVPKEVVPAHPHLLLLLENYERAAASAADGDADRFRIYVQRAQTEEVIFRGVLKQLGYSLSDNK